MGYGYAFIMGGIIALAGFGLLALSCIAVGGYAELDYCGGALLFIIGGIAGVITAFIRSR